MQNQYKFINKFKCTQDKCQDNCCFNWKMQVNDSIVDLYRKQSDELYNAIEQRDNYTVMKIDKKTNGCIKFTEGLCGIHKNYGENYLADSCYFFPRIIKKLNNNILMSATLSCPEITRIILNDDDPFSIIKADFFRLPESISDIAPKETEIKDFLITQQNILTLFNNNDLQAKDGLQQLITISRSLDHVEKKDYLPAINAIITIATNLIAEPKINEQSHFSLIYILIFLINNSKDDVPVKLFNIINKIEQDLMLKINWENNEIIAEQQNIDIYRNKVNNFTNSLNLEIDIILKKYIQALLVNSSYPFSSFDFLPSEHIAIITVKSAILKIILVCFTENQRLPDQVKIIEIIQTFSRFIDHLSQPKIFLLILKDFGWLNEATIGGLLEV